MMRLYWMAGDRDAALAQYKRCSEILRDELGVDPMRETTRVYHQMANNLFSQPPPLKLAPAQPGSLNPGETPEGSLQALAEKTLLRLHYLQSLLEDTRSELRTIESLIHHELLNSDVSR
jgi:hypothetical protein